MASAIRHSLPCAGVSPWNCRICGLVILLCLAPWKLPAQALPETIGQIEGDDIAVKGSVHGESESARSVTVLASGSEVTVRSGQAHLVLVEGGEIGICGPAHFSLLKSGGAITLALDYGRVHARLEPSVPLTIYTPLIVATPVAIGRAARDATVGLETTGAMCALAARGAVRIEQQLSGQSLLVPQSGEVALAGGQLESLLGITGTCGCEALVARAAPLAGPKPPELSVPVRASLARPIKPPEKPENNDKRDIEPPDPKPTATEEPIYKVLMPPLTFEAASPTPPPEPSPETILLAREVRLRPAVVFHGRIEPLPPPPPVWRAVRGSRAAEDAPTNKQVGVVARVWNFFRRLTSRGPCAGAGCG